MIVISGISLYRGSLNRDFVPYILLLHLPGSKMLIVISGNIVISRIAISGFHCIKGSVLLTYLFFHTVPRFPEIEIMR